jgi:predicted transcriptional regulator
MSNGGKELNELIRRRGFRLSAVASAIDVDRQTISRWTDNAPIGKLIKLSRFTGIPILEVIRCFELEEESSSTAPETRQ